MLYILYGQDDFSLNQAVEKIKADLGDREMVATNTSSLEGQRLTLSELEINVMPPLFYPHIAWL